QRVGWAESSRPTNVFNVFGGPRRLGPPYMRTVAKSSPSEVSFGYFRFILERIGVSSLDAVRFSRESWAQKLPLTTANPAKAAPGFPERTGSSLAWGERLSGFVVSRPRSAS